MSEFSQVRFPIRQCTNLLKGLFFIHNIIKYKQQCCLQMSSTMFHHDQEKTFSKPPTPRTPNANMADHSVGARDKSHEGEASQSLMFCFLQYFSRKVLLCRRSGHFILVCLQVAESLNATKSSTARLTLGKIVETKERRSHSRGNLSLFAIFQVRS